MVTVVENVSWFRRIRESIKGFVVGLAFFVAAFPVLFWNEGRAVKTEKSLKEGAGAVVSVPPDRVDATFEQKLVHISGKANTEETLADSEFGVTANAISLRRHSVGRVEGAHARSWRARQSVRCRVDVRDHRLPVDQDRGRAARPPAAPPAGPDRALRPGDRVRRHGCGRL